MMTRQPPAKTPFGELPILPHLPAIKQALDRDSVALLKADPGAGKTTGVPTYLSGFFDRIMVLQPRRLATRLTAERVAHLVGEPIGQSVGYLMRHEAQRSEATRILFVTEGMLPRLMLNDPLLSKWNLIILDEFHERHLQTDLALAHLRLIRRERKDLRFLIMSATLELQTLEEALGVKAMNVSVSRHAVEQHYQPFSTHEGIDQPVRRALRFIRENTAVGNVLVFLPGAREIRQCERSLAASLESGQRIIPLTAALSRNFSLIGPADKGASIVLTTNVAETSITVPDVSAVIDSGLVKASTVGGDGAMPLLLTGKSSRSSCQQRAGRAGRTRPGICIRLFSESDFNQRPLHSQPEILRSDLTAVMLETAGLYPRQTFPWRSLPWLDPPSDEAWSGFERILRALGAIDSNGLVTASGLAMAKIPLHPRLAAFVMRARQDGQGEQALLCALIISEEIRPEGVPVHHGKCDVIHLAEEFLRQRKGSRTVPHRHAIERTYTGIAKSLGLRLLSTAMPFDEGRLRLALFLSFADQAARIRKNTSGPAGGGAAVYHHCLGGEGVLSRSSVLDREEWVLTMQFIRQSTRQMSRGQQDLPVIHAATAIDADWLSLDPFRLSMQPNVEPAREGKNTAQAATSFPTAYGKISLSGKPQAAVKPDTQEAGWQSVLGACSDTEQYGIYHKQLDWLESKGIEHDFPRFDGEFQDLLALVIRDELQDGGRPSVLALIKAQLTYDQGVKHARLFPTHFTTAEGKRLPIDYSADWPSVSGKIQIFFNTLSHPAIADGSLPLTVILLAPSSRPAQITSDLPGFWRGSYQEVRKELKKRYPRHAWPEKPPGIK